MICLQELFDLPVLNKVVRADLLAKEREKGNQQGLFQVNTLRERQASQDEDASITYPWILADVDPKPYRLNSGLFIASRYPVIDPEFMRFSIAARDDILAGKVTTDILPVFFVTFATHYPTIS